MAYKEEAFAHKKLTAGVSVTSGKRVSAGNSKGDVAHNTNVAVA